MPQTLCHRVHGFGGGGDRTKQHTLTKHYLKDNRSGSDSMLTIIRHFSHALLIIVWHREGRY